MRKGRRLWDGLLAVGLAAMFLLGMAVWFDWLSQRSCLIAWSLVTLYSLVLHSVRRFVDPKYAETLAARRAARQKQPTAEEALKAYPKWW